MKKYNVVIIGGGAAGLTAAASLDGNKSICIIEKNKIPGRKIAATGGGRCNITNEACEHKDIALEFFRSLGLETYSDEEGRFYPYSNQASDVVKVLMDKIATKNVDIITEFEVTSAVFENGEYVVADSKGNKIAGNALMIATGGKAAPQLGTTGDGYVIAKGFGHQVNRVYPILTGIKCGEFKDIKGVRAKGRVSLYKDNLLIAEELGEIQFTEEGISGICVMNLTIHIKTEKGEALDEALARYHMVLDLAPDFDEEQLAKRTSSFGILSEKLSARVGIDVIKNWKLQIKGVKGWKDAQCTAGGVDLGQINLETMESKLLPRLYFAGEVLDIQGPCGGYNLQNAWETGLKVAKSLSEQK